MFQESLLHFHSPASLSGNRSQKAWNALVKKDKNNSEVPRERAGWNVTMLYTKKVEIEVLLDSLLEEWK